MSVPEQRGDNSNELTAKYRREPATTVLPDLTDLFDRRIDPQRRAEFDRRLVPQYRMPESELVPNVKAERTPVPDIDTPTFRFDRGRRGFAAVVAKPVGRALVMSSPMLLTGIMLLLAKFALARVGADALPGAILGLWGLQLVSLILARGLALPDFAVVWATMVITLGVLVPLLALQALLGDIPYVSLAESSAGPFLAASLGVVFALVASAVGLAVISREQPERASILLLPMALVIPALLGVAGEALGLSILEPLAATMLASGVWAAVMWLAPRGVWLLATPVALLVQLVVLLIRNGGPVPGVEAGTVIAVGYGSVLATLVAVSVALPLFARWIGTITGDRAR